MKRNNQLNLEDIVVILVDFNESFDLTVYKKDGKRLSDGDYINPEVVKILKL